MLNILINFMDIDINQLFSMYESTVKNYINQNQRKIIHAAYES